MARPPKPNLNVEDRRILLRRRALFLSAAVAATACGAGSNQAPKDASAVNVGPVTAEPTEESAKPPKRNTPVGCRRTATHRGAVRRDGHRPPHVRAFEEGSDPAANQRHGSGQQHAQLQACSNVGSDAAVEQLAQAYSTASHLVSELTPLCPGSSEQAKQYEAVVKEQQDFFNAKLKLYRDEMMKRMSRDGDFSDRFSAALSRANAFAAVGVSRLRRLVALRAPPDSAPKTVAISRSSQAPR